MAIDFVDKWRGMSKEYVYRDLYETGQSGGNHRANHMGSKRWVTTQSLYIIIGIVKHSTYLSAAMRTAHSAGHYFVNPHC